MEFISIAAPAPSKGMDYSKEKVQVVPDESLSLEEILERFTRGESIGVGHDGQFGGDDEDEENPAIDVDLEKIKHSDLVDKAEFTERLKKTQRDYEKQEKARQKSDADAKAAAAKEKYEADVQAAAEKLSKKSQQS